MKRNIDHRVAMPTTIVKTGHSVGDADGIILAADASICTLLQRSAHELIGLSYLQITHPDDHVTNTRMLAALPAGDAPITIRKRYLRSDGLAVPVEVSVSRFSIGERSGRLVGTVAWHTAPTPSPGLWRTAYAIEQLNGLRKQLLGSDLFPDHPMSIMLRIYIAEMEGRTITLQQIAQELGMAPPLAERWLNVLADYGLLDPTTDADTPRQLSDKGLLRLEHLLRAAGYVSDGIFGGRPTGGGG